MSDSNSFDPDSPESRKAFEGFLEQEELRDLLADNPAIEVLYRFTQSLERIPWFARGGFPLSGEEVALATDYVAGLGVPEAMPAVVESFADAALVAENPEVNSIAWEMEEQLRGALIADALNFMEEDVLNIMLTQIGSVAADIVDAAAREAAAMDEEEAERTEADEPDDASGPEDAFDEEEDSDEPDEQNIEENREALLKAMVGSAVQACHQAALVLASGTEDDHPFTAKFGLYESGRWPISISGSSFNIY